MAEKTAQRSLITRIIHGGKWQNFAAGIACGAAYVSLHSLHWHPRWMTIIELVLFFLNVVVFTVNFALLAISAIIKPERFFGNLKNPSLNLLVPLVALDYATLTIGIVYYGCELGNFECGTYSSSYLALFWTYFGVSLCCCIPIILVWFGSVGKAHELSAFSLTGCFLVFPMMLNGTVGITVLSRVTADHPGTLQVLLTSYIMQGLGFSVSMAFIVVSQYRAIRYGFHRGASAASAFIAAGPPGFTALALLRLGEYARNILPRHTPIPQTGADIFYYAAMPAALFLQGLAIYYWIFALLPWLLTWKAHLVINPAGSWPMTFPTAGLTSTFLALGDAFGSTAFYILQAVWAGIIVFEFLVIFSCWLYRLLRPTDPELKEARSKAWNDEHLSFWGSYREAELAEQKYLMQLKTRNSSRDRSDGAINGGTV